MKFPNRETVIGKLIDDYLKQNINIDDRAIHLLFSANRWECKDIILKHLSEGTTVILDRYMYSGIAYSTAKGLDMEWCVSCDISLPVPDIVLYLNNNFQTTLSEREDFGTERYEKIEFQEVVAKKFLELHNHLLIDNPEYSRWTFLSANKSINDLHNEIKNLVASYLLEKTALKEF
jgi:dTMP kinase